jgi:hypothetical protein
MAISAGELRRVHAEIGRADEIIDQRRTLYSTVLEMVTGDHTDPDMDIDLLDSPAVRGNLGEVLSGQGTHRPEACVPLDGLAVPHFTDTVDGFPIRLASTTAVEAALSGSLTRVAAALASHGSESGLAFLADPDDPATKAAFSRILEGVRLAVQVAPDLALDILPHVSLFAVLATRGSSRLGSASAREYPGVILIPAPESAIEVAEALIHEGAHQKFFDIATTRALFGSAPAEHWFIPSWATGGVPGWPIEQAFAAWHAYTCLAAFAAALPSNHELPAFSLLPHAECRAAEIGDWLLGNGPALGRDGHSLLANALGRSPLGGCHDTEVAVSDLGFEPDSPEWTYRSQGERILLARRGIPPELYWIPQFGL